MKLRRHVIPAVGGTAIAVAAVSVAYFRGSWFGAHSGFPFFLGVAAAVGCIVIYLAVRDGITTVWQKLFAGQPAADASQPNDLRYRTMLETTGAIVWEMPSSGQFETPQPAWMKFTGQSFEQSRGWGWLSMLHPEDREAAEAGWRRALSTKDIFNSEFRLRRHDGEYRYMSVRAIPILNEQSKSIEWLGAYSDISQRRHAEEQSNISLRKLNLAIEAGNIGVFVWNVETGEMEWSDMHYKLFGVDPKKPAPNHDQFLSMIVEEDRDGVEAERQAAIAQRRSYFVKYRLRRGDGQIQWIECHGRVQTMGDGQRVSVLGVVRDVTDQNLAEIQLNRSQEELKAMNRTLEKHVRDRTAEAEMRSEQLRALALDLTDTESRERRRLAGVLHDHFQQLVSAAKLKAGMIRRKLGDADSITTVRQLENLLSDAIEASRTLATELSPPVLYDAGLHPALEWLARRMEQDHHLTVHLTMVEDAEPDNDQIRTILFECLRELLFNVIKHAGTKEAWVEVGMRDEGLLKAAVSDNGKGFDPAVVAGTRKLDGTFGLFSIRERLSAIGGLAKIQSSLGQGTRVEFTIPTISAGMINGSTETPTASTQLESSKLPNDKVRVLVADDHKLFREGLISLISQEPYVQIVGQAADGEEAVRLARELKPQIMLVDVSMPKLNGIQVATCITSELPGTQIIGLSMHEFDDMAEAMRKAGAAAYCPKSGPSEQLLAELRSCAATIQTHTRISDGDKSRLGTRSNH
jgi:PAS domain S-box-containing protein